MSDHPALDLDREAAAALDTLLTAYGAAVSDLLVAAGLDEPVAYLCLSPGQEEGMATLPLLYAGRAADRERLLGEGLDDWTGAWNPYAMRDEDDLVHPVYDEHGEGRYVAFAPEAVEAWETVRDAVEGRCLSPEYWVHRRAAHALNRRPLPLPATDDFAVWVFDFEAGDGELLDMLSSVLRPETFELLRARGLVGSG